MKATEARRRLERSGWSFVRQTSNRHELWRRPDGEIRTLALNDRNLDRNETAQIRQAERHVRRVPKPHQQEATMTTTSDVNAATPVKPMENGALPMPIYANFVVYRGQGNPAQIYFGNDEAAHLGGLGARVSVVLRDGLWRLEPDSTGLSTVRADKGKNGRFVVATSAITRALPTTGRTDLPYQLTEKGFVLFPERVNPVPIMTSEMLSRVAKTTAPTAVAAPPVLRKVAGSGASLDDLKTALEMLRAIASELGAELYIEDGMLRAKIVL